MYIVKILIYYYTALKTGHKLKIHILLRLPDMCGTLMVPVLPILLHFSSPFFNNIFLSLYIALMYNILQRCVTYKY